jgi:predicted RNA-binding Zn-ribbon protein involved in translation (DUF1610 family)
MSQELKEVLIACRRNIASDPGKIAQSSADLPEQHCDSKTAYLLPTASKTYVSYKCKKCGHTWVTMVGGQFIGM